MMHFMFYFLIILERSSEIRTILSRIKKATNVKAFEKKKLLEEYVTPLLKSNIKKKSTHVITNFL